MIHETIEILGKSIILYGKTGAEICIIDLIGGHEERISSDEDIAYVGIEVEDWNKELSPWKAPAVFGKENFGDGASKTISYITNDVMPEIQRIFSFDKENVKYIIGGYSLAGLFALWAGYKTDIFYGVAAASPSVWFPKWDEFIRENTIKAEKVYLSLGDREAKTKNHVLSKVADCMKNQYDVLSSQIGEDNCKFEWNEGNHFKDADLRKAKAFNSVIDLINKKS